MSKRRWHDFDDGFDEESLFADEEYAFERERKRRRSPREHDEAHRAVKRDRHREPGGSKSFGVLR